MHIRKKYLTILHFSLIILLFQTSFLNPKTIKTYSTPDVINVPNDYKTIQEAINAANPGDTIFVENGTYYEHILINKSVILIGENPKNTIIDGQGMEMPIIRITAANVTISNFTITNTTKTKETYGIMIYRTENITLTNNLIKETYWGICLDNSDKCKIINNTITNNIWGAVFRIESNNNDIIYNNIEYNKFGIYFLDNTCENNTFYHNNLINNDNQTSKMFLGKNTKWDNGAEGNYWSDYTGEDTDGNGIGDTPYPDSISPIDNYPLIEPWKPVRTYTINGYKVTIHSNFTIASLNYSEQYKQVSFYVTGPKNKPGFCNVTIPKALLNINATEKWLILIEDENATDITQIKNQTSQTSFYIPINANGLNLTTQKIRIKVVKKEETNLPPLAKFTFTPTQPEIFEPVKFFDNSTDPDGTIINRTWNFGDGNITETSSTIITHTYTKAGTYTVTLTVKDDENATDIAIAHITIRKLTSSLTINVYPSTIIIGNYTVINGTLTPQKEANITIYYKAQTEENWKILNITQTNSQGKYTYQWTPTKCGTYEIMASWKGDQETKPANSSIETLEVTKIISELTIELSPLPATIKTNITISGKLKPKIANASIKISYLLMYQSEIWTQLTTAKTNINGTYICNWTPTIAGYYIIVANWEGNEKTYGANATTGLILIDRLPSNITIEVIPTNATVGSEIKINGKITPPRAYANVTIKISRENVTLLIENVKTDQEGNFHYSWFPNKEGTYEIMASWKGDQETKPANSKKITVNVSKKPSNQPGLDLTQFYGILTLIAIIILGLSIYFYLKREKKALKLK